MKIISNYKLGGILKCLRIQLTHRIPSGRVLQPRTSLEIINFVQSAGLQNPAARSPAKKITGRIQYISEIIICYVLDVPKHLK